MKKSDLIALLADYPDDMEIVVSAYEDGYNAASELSMIRVSPYTGGDEWHGALKADDKGDSVIFIT